MLLSWAFFLNMAGIAGPFLLGGFGAVAVVLFFLWAFTNLGTFLSSPEDYKIWKQGGGDPFFCTLDPPFNTDPDSTRYAEPYRERLRLECEDVNRQMGLPPNFMTGQTNMPPTPRDAGDELDFLD